MAHRQTGWIIYTPSNAAFSDMSIKADETTATANSQVLSVGPTIQNFWPGHAADMRAVYGYDAPNRYRDSIRCTDPAFIAFPLGGTFPDDEGNSYTVIGYRLERFRIRNLK